VNTERLVERETLLYRLDSELNRTVLNSCGNPIFVAQITRDFRTTRFFVRTEPFTPKKKPKKEVDYFWKHQTSNSRLYDTVFDNSIPFCKNDPLRITYFKIQSVRPALCALAPRQLVSRVGIATPWNYQSNIFHRQIYLTESAN
jgi:hypothetical protein